MPYVTSFERLAREESEKKGRAAILDLLEPALKSRFGEAGWSFAVELKSNLDFDMLSKISNAAVHESKTIDELRAMLP